MPGSNYPIQALYLDIPVVVEGHTGKNKAANIKKVTDDILKPISLRAFLVSG